MLVSFRLIIPHLFKGGTIPGYCVCAVFSPACLNCEQHCRGCGDMVAKHSQFKSLAGNHAVQFEVETTEESNVEWSSKDIINNQQSSVPLSCLQCIL